MRAVLLIGIPMVVLAGLMVLVFRAADPSPPPAVRADVSGEEAGNPSAEEESSEPLMPPKLGRRRKPSAKGSGEPRPPATAPALDTKALATAAEKIDDAVNLAKARALQNRSVQLDAAIRALATNKPAEAVAACNRILKAHPDDPKAVTLKAEAYVLMSRFEDAGKQYERAIELRPEENHLRYDYGVVCSRLKRFTDAVRAYEQCLKHDPDHMKASYNLAVLYGELGKLSDASRLWAKVTKASPERAEAWFRRGTVALQLGDHDVAAEALSKADELEPGRPDTLTNLGLAYHELGKAGDAIAAFQRAREAKPEYLPAVNGIADVYIRYFERNPSSEEHLQCGLQWCAHSAGIRPYQPRVAAVYRRVLKVRPDCVPAISGLAQVLAAAPAAAPRGKEAHAEALALCRKSLDLKPDQPEVKALLARLTATTQPAS